MIKHDNCILSLENDLRDIRKEIKEMTPGVNPKKYHSAQILEREFVSAIRILKMIDSLEI